MQTGVKNESIFVSNNGNYILDCKFDTISEPLALHKELKLTLGVVETGLFINMTDRVMVGEDSGIKILENRFRAMSAPNSMLSTVF